MDSTHAAAPPADGDEAALRRLVEALYLHYHYDFRDYAFASLRRRTQAALAAFGIDSVERLHEQVLRDEALFTRLLGYLTVQVTEMFRDPAYFRALREQVMPLLRTYPSLKLWVAGCASGEEAYSLAILLDECGLLERALIYATDINPAALARAESGVVDIDRLPGFADNHRRTGAISSFAGRYTVAYDRAVIDRALRRHIVFSDHSLATDSVFAEVQFVSCRNVLIYFDRKLQNRAVGLFREALVHRGFLGIGAKESLRFTAHADAFEALAPAERIYRKQQGVHAG